MNSDDYVLAKLISGPWLPPAISTLHSSVSKPGYSFAYHSYADEVEILLVQHGASYVGINNQFIRVKKNECLIIFPRVTHNYFLKENESCRMIDLVFKPGDLSPFTPLDFQNTLQFLNEVRDPHTEYLRFLDNGEINAVLEHILAQYESQEDHSGVLQKIYFTELYVLLSKIIRSIHGDSGRPNNPHVTQGLNYLRNFYNTHLTVTEVAAHVGVTSRHFSRLFGQELGMTVQEYISILRVAKAKDLLANSDMDITGIAFSLGFNTSQYFTTCFKQMEHLTPKVYRQMVRAQPRPE
jgi:AraC family transcriptional regulator, melibiose operon regulatory protein